MLAGTTRESVYQPEQRRHCGEAGAERSSRCW